MVKLSHQYGNTTLSAFGFGIHALLLCGQPEEYQAGLEYGEMAIALNERFPNPFVRGTIHFFFNCFVQHWRQHKKWNLPLHKIAHQGCSESGAYVYGVYNVIFFFFQSFCSELTLTEVQNYYNKFLPFVEKVNDQDVLGVLKSLLQLIANLQGVTTARDSLDDDQFNEARYFSQLTTRDYGNGLCYYYFTKMFLAFFSDQFEEAIKMAAALQPYYVYTHGLYHRALYHFYLALSLTASYHKQSPSEQKTTWEALQGHRDCLANWAVHSPDNYQHQYVLVCAEMARISNQPWEALTLYEQAILFARASEVLVHEALANELAAKFYFARQLDKIGMVYLKEAYRLYQVWEAKSKIKYLEERYPWFLKPVASYTTSLFTTSLSLPLNTMMATSYYKGSSTMTPILDLASVLKASQALAGEIVLEKLLKNMMAIVLENAGAERGCLLLPQQEDWLIEAEIQVDSGEVPVLQAIPLERYPQIATTIIRYVARSQKVVVLNNATVEGLFTRDPYILTKRPLSVLGVPLKNQGRLTGILYLENNLTTGAFTADRLEILNFLSSQIAVSIENAKLYAELHERERTVKQFLEAMPVGVAVHHPDGTLYYVNKKGTQLFGKGMVPNASPEELIETYQLCLAGTQQPYPSDRAPVVLALQGQTVSVDDIEIHQPAKIVPAEAWGTPVFDEQGQITYAIVAFQDITERKQAEADKLRLVQEQEAKNAALRYSHEIEAKNTELVRLNQEKNEFLGIAAHDLKNPLSAILGLADLITMDFDGLLKEEVIDYANGIAISAKQMFDLIVNLLDVNQIESGKFKISLQPTDLFLTVQPILKGYQERATAKQIQLHYPPPTEPYLALIDPNITRQVLDNLISNAIKYSPPGKTVYVRLLQTGAMVRCEIQDEGPGLTEKDQQKLFGKFARLTAQPTGGEHSTGLGLFIVKKLVTAMNGKVWCESEVGKGATFVVEFSIPAISSDSLII
jgi:PAS domain S-box-containing protein